MPEAFDPFQRPELLHCTRRARQIDELQRVYNGKQYDGRPDWWTGKYRAGDREKPLRERRPCIIYKLGQAMVKQVTRFLFGDERFPRVTVAESDGTEFGYPVVSEESAEELSSWFANLIDTAQIKSLMGGVSTKAIACKTAVIVIEAKDGKIQFLLPEPQHCAAEFQDGDPRSPVTRLLWTYQFAKEVADEQGRPQTKRYVFRREWDSRNVYVYPDAELPNDQNVQWAAPTVTPHGLKFCPVMWVRNDAEHSTDTDGESLIGDLREEFEALDMALSRRHQGIIYLGAPQMVETGVEEGDGPDQTGRKAGPPGYSGKGAYNVAPKARRVAPDCVWTYENEKVTVGLVETTGKAFEAGTHHVTDIRSRILEIKGVVLTSMTDTIGSGEGGRSRSTSGQMSGRFLKLAHAPLIALTQEYRDHWWPNVLRPLLSMLARIVADMPTDAAGNKMVIFIPGTEKALPLLQQFQVPATVDGEGNVLDEGGWIEPQLEASWGQFFQPDVSERQIAVESAITARDGKLITEETAASDVGPMYGVENVQKELEEIEAGKVDEPAPGFNETEHEMGRLFDEIVQPLDDDAEPRSTSAEGAGGNAPTNVSAGSSITGGPAKNGKRRRKKRKRSASAPAP